MHKNPYKHRFIAGSSKCSTKPLSILLTKLLTHIKQGLQKYCETSYSRSGVNQMWILKNSKELLEHLQSPNFNHITSINRGGSRTSTAGGAQVSNEAEGFTEARSAERGRVWEGVPPPAGGGPGGFHRKFFRNLHQNGAF